MTDGYESAQRVRDAHGRQYHIALAPGEVADSVLLVGDPARAELVAGLMDRVELERRNREYVSFTGMHDSLRFTVVGTGIGPDNMEIAVVELCECVDASRLIMIRCGTSGALQPDIELGDLVITHGAYRLENTSLFYVGEGYPAVADPAVALALVQAATESKAPHHFGITATAPGFYGAQARDIPGFPLRRPGLLEDLRRQGIKNIEMEVSTLLTLGTLRGFRAGAVCVVFASRDSNTFMDPTHKQAAERRCVDVGIRALHRLADREPTGSSVST